MTKYFRNFGFSRKLFSSVTDYGVTSYSSMKLQETDENLMLRYQAGEEAAFSELYGRYHRRMYGYLQQKTVSFEVKEEIFQNIWTKLHQSRFRYKSQFKFSAWLFTIARSVLVDFWRKEKNFQNSAVLDEEKIATASPSPQEAQFQVSELPWEVLSPEDKQSLEWRYLEEASFEEIGQRLGLNPVNVRQKISRTLKKLKQSFFRKKL